MPPQMDNIYEERHHNALNLVHRVPEIVGKVYAKFIMSKMSPMILNILLVQSVESDGVFH